MTTRCDDARFGMKGALASCLFLSGAAGLIYEVIWLREIALVMGHTVYAVTALLAAFLGGLALGAHLAGRWLERRAITPRFYALLELGIALTAPLVPGAFELLDPLFGVLYRALGAAPIPHALAQLAICALILAVPTVLMGMTLPAAVAILVPKDRAMQRETGLLYALNSLGGAIGAALVALVILAHAGAFNSCLVGAALNLIAALISALAVRAGEPRGSDAPAAAGADWPAPSRRVLLLSYALAGFAALALQVGWSRLVTLSIGSTLFGFAMTLVSFILGLALGSMIVPRLIRAPVRALFILHALIALWSTGSMVWLGGLPDRILSLMSISASFESLLALQLLLIFSTIAVPTIAMGAIFPLVAELLRENGASSERAVGSTYAANTLGTILGAIIAGFLLVPWLGMRGTVIASAALTALVALIYVPRRRAPLAALALALLIFGAVALAPPWSREIYTLAPFLQAHQGDARTYGALIDHREGPTTAVAVRELRSGERLLYVGGVLEATSTAPFHEYLAHLGLTLHGAARSVLVVGLGAGNTLESVLRFPVQKISCVELSPEVVEIARAHFPTEMRRIDGDPRVQLIVADGRAHLRHAGETYDVIISQPSYPWMAGAAPLFTQEYFAELREHLEPRGLAIMWFPAQSARSTTSLLQTWREVFSESYAQAPAKNMEMYFVVGFRDRAPPDSELLRRFERIAPDLPERIQLNTDDNAFVELDTFRDLINERNRDR